MLTVDANSLKAGNVQGYVGVDMMIILWLLVVFIFATSHQFVFNRALRPGPSKSCGPLWSFLVSWEQDF